MTKFKNMKKTTKMVYMSLLTALALILFIFEGMIPLPFITPGAKLGLANLIIMIAVYTLSCKEALTVLLLRIILSTLFAGNISTFMYSLAGGLLSFVIMIIVKKLGGKYISVIGVSACAAVFHNIGQLLVASLILENLGVMLYLPVLSIAGIGTGIFVGLSANIMLNHLNKILYFK